MHFPVIFLKYTFQLFSFNFINEDHLLKRGEVIAFLNDIIYYMIPLQNAITSPKFYDTN